MADAVYRKQRAPHPFILLFLLRPHFKRLRREILVTHLLFAAENDPVIRNCLSSLLFVILHIFQKRVWPATPLPTTWRNFGYSQTYFFDQWIRFSETSRTFKNISYWVITFNTPYRTTISNIPFRPSFVP